MIDFAILLVCIIKDVMQLIIRKKEILAIWCIANHSNHFIIRVSSLSKAILQWEHVLMQTNSNCTNLQTSQSKWLEHTDGRSFVIASIPQFQKNGDVPNLALTVGTPRISWALLTSGKFLKTMYWSGSLNSEESKYIGVTKSICCWPYITSCMIWLKQYQNLFWKLGKEAENDLHRTNITTEGIKQTPWRFIIFSLFLNHGSWGYSDFQHFLYFNELTIDKHLFCQSLFRSQHWAFHYMASVWSFLLVEHSSTII